jgi:hypothetical protein
MSQRAMHVCSAIVVLMFCVTTAVLGGAGSVQHVTLQIFFPGVAANGQISNNNSLGTTVDVHCKINTATDSLKAHATGTVQNQSGANQSFSDIEIFFPGFGVAKSDTYHVKADGKFTATAHGLIQLVAAPVPTEPEEAAGNDRSSAPHSGSSADH